ncbi:uncharacterized protein LOC132185592 [Corylus avellana]|uniref:uncharacterized protein LOC132185592 n=1 Tax=Corylus avellana TaxID=13451 RepID=UPI00286B465C|nr:uncharacterized protein LOC132185592 [Corylus avellana]
MAIAEEEEKLLAAGFIRKVDYPTWISNVVMVKKANGKWRICVDFTDLNQACPKDNFSLPRIDLLIDSTAGHELLSFMDAFSGYNQIKMDLADQEKTAFIIDRGRYCYITMPFGLKNAGATHQRFIAQSTDRSLPFFKILRKSFEWNDECKVAFKNLKEYLASPPLLNRAELGEPLYVYLASTTTTVNFVLIREGIEKLAFALITIARRLRPYYQAHPIEVLTSHPLKKSLHKSNTSSCLVQWSVELGDFDIGYLPRTAIKAQVVALFLGQFTEDTEETNEGNKEPVWFIEVDGSSSLERSGAGIVIKTPDGVTVKHAVRFKFQATNNKAQYEALIAGLHMPKQHGANSVSVQSDSQLVVGQLMGEYEAKGEKIKLSESPPGEKTTISESKTPAIEDHQASRYTLFKSVVKYLVEGNLQENPAKAKAVRCRASRYLIQNDVLYKRSFIHPLLRCLSNNEADNVLREIHEGICGNHSGKRSLAHKALRAGYCWPTMAQDAHDMVKNCKKSQQFANVPKSPPEDLTSIFTPWPFTLSGVDIVGSLPSGKGGVKFALVTVDYFTKWAEAKALATFT